LRWHRAGLALFAQHLGPRRADRLGLQQGAEQQQSLRHWEPNCFRAYVRSSIESQRAGRARAKADNNGFQITSQSLHVGQLRTMPDYLAVQQELLEELGKCVEAAHRASRDH
jgi:hypothetical protein